MTNSSDIHVDVFVSQWPVLNEKGSSGGTFSPTTSALITGPTEAALVDAQYLKEDVEALGDLVEESGKSLTTIYVTHAHADHYFGITELLKRFSTARAVALPQVVKDIVTGNDQQFKIWKSWFGDRVVDDPSAIPEPLKSSSFTVDGRPVRITEISQADISPSSIVHVPDAGAVISADLVYNEIHPMLGLTDLSGMREWLSNLDIVEALAPTMIVAGHRKPTSDDGAVEDMLATTRRYIRDFIDVASSAKDAGDVVEAITAKYPDHGNRWTLEFSAKSWFGGQLSG